MSTMSNVRMQMYVMMDVVISLYLQVVSVLWRFSFMTANVNFINELAKSI